MSIDTSEAPMSEITIQGAVLTVPAPFKEGHVLRPNEAGVLNQTYAENIRNNFAATVKKAVVEAAAAETDVDLGALQTGLVKYIEGYDFGVRQGGGGRSVVDPVRGEAFRLAAERVKAALKKAGHNLKDVGAKKVGELAAAALEKYPQLREQAEAIVKIKSSVAVESLDLEI